ncbi:unnamed protein product [Closterium sp. Yama58-4]|nr:unnamed protein product [Closterium sp. Yama58-4]
MNGVVPPNPTVQPFYSIRSTPHPSIPGTQSQVVECWGMNGVVPPNPTVQPFYSIRSTPHPSIPGTQSQVVECRGMNGVVPPNPTVQPFYSVRPNPQPLEPSTQSQVVECRGVNGIVPPDATVRDEALRQYLVEAHALFRLFFGSIDRLLQQQQPPQAPSAASTHPSGVAGATPSSELHSDTHSHDSPSTAPPSADLARACLQAFLPDFLTGACPFYLVWSAHVIPLPSLRSLLSLSHSSSQF